MSTLTPICNCRTLRNIIVSFTPEPVPPAEGYVLRWRSIIDESVIPNIVSAYTVINVPKICPGTYVIEAVPRCCKIQVEMTASCGFSQFGTTRSITIDANATYAATFSTAGIAVPCNSVNGMYTVNINGTPNQMLKLRLTFGGNIAHNSLNGTNGTCAYLYGEITATDGTNTSTQQYFSNSTSTGGSANVNLKTSPEIGGLVVPSNGVLSVNTVLIGYNVLNLNETVATIEVVSIDGIVVNNISHLVSCKLITSSVTAPSSIGAACP